jgi:hypothetical protein
MLMNSDLMLALADDRHRTLIAERDRARLLASARLARKSRKSRKAGKSPAVRRKPTGTLASCE